jgi:hypothetical protein
MSIDKRNEERAAAVIDAFGTVPARWPEAERAAVQTLISGSTSLQQQLADARALEDALDSAPAVAVSAGLSERILAEFDRIAQRPSVRRVLNRLGNVVWPDAPLWKPSAALAASLAIGLVLGILSPLGSSVNNNASDMAVAFNAPQVDDQ